jgi:hypothetical protein
MAIATTRRAEGTAALQVSSPRETLARLGPCLGGPIGRMAAGCDRCIGSAPAARSRWERAGGSAFRPWGGEGRTVSARAWDRAERSSRAIETAVPGWTTRCIDRGPGRTGMAGAASRPLPFAGVSRSIIGGTFAGSGTFETTWAAAGPASVPAACEAGSIAREASSITSAALARAGTASESIPQAASTAVQAFVPPMTPADYLAPAAAKRLLRQPLRDGTALSRSPSSRRRRGRRPEAEAARARPGSLRPRAAGESPGRRGSGCRSA